jgi:hypothetical protein
MRPKGTERNETIKTKQNGTERNRTKRNRQNKTERNHTKQNGTEQNGTERNKQNKTERNGIKRNKKTTQEKSDANINNHWWTTISDSCSRVINKDQNDCKYSCLFYVQQCWSSELCRSLR